jgi:LPXTG-motif cell wall-anchored protein
VLTSGALPTTGFNLIGLLAAALACLGIGGGAIVAERRRRPGQEA